MRDNAPSLPIEPSMSSSGKSSPVISLTPSRNSRTEGRTISGHLCWSSLVTAAASFATALSRWIMLP